MTRKDTNVIGRREELSLLRELIAPPHKESHVLLLLGDPGLGKTVLLAEAAREAKAAGMRVLATTGRESEQDLAFAGLHQLLRPVLDRVARLPTRQAEALRGAFGLSDDPAPPDALLTGIAVLTLLSELSDEQPLLVTADDTQWLDRASLDALAFAARRLESEQLVLLAGARGGVPPAGFERDLPQLLLRPLTRPDAGLLLDAQPRPPHGRLREQVLTQAVGNPLALIELSRVIATDPDAGRRWTAEPLPLTGQLTGLMAAQYVTLPPAARSALLLAAAADSPDLTTAIPGLSADALAPAEAAGLMRLDTPGPRFAHPLTRSAVYHAAPFAERAAAHRQVADVLRDQPDRHAWHLAAAALEPDEHLAALLVDSAAQAQRRGGAAAAARALERAAELSPGEPDKARRLLAAAELALPAGQADWVRELAAKVLTLTSDPDLRIAARLDIGWSLLWSNRNADAFDTLLSVAAEASPRLPAIAWQAAWMAATVAHQTGLPEVCAKARAALDLLDSRDGPPPTAEDWPAGRADEYRIWIRACTDPFGERADIVPRLRRTAGGFPLGPGYVRRGGLGPGRNRTGGQGAAGSPQPTARPGRPRCQRRRAVGTGMGMRRQRALGRRTRRRPRGGRHRRRLQDGNRRGLGRPHHSHRGGHARRTRPGGTAAGPRARRRGHLRIPRVRRQDLADGRSRRAGPGQLRDRVRSAQPTLRRRRHTPAPSLLLPRRRRPRRCGGARRTAPRSAYVAGARAGSRGPRARAAPGTTHGPGPRTARRARQRRSPPRSAPGRSHRRHVAVRTGPATAGLRGMVAPAATDQRRQAHPRDRPGNVPPSRGGTVDPARGIRAACLRRNGASPAGRPRARWTASLLNSARSSSSPDTA
ncbi:AAA family ATPase [Streptomyces mirabilis]|uniref:AAA family ATPase n=1 Tax=Streptomyces mirabilis TaxID=68239 RepID=UPI0036DC6150